MKHNLLPQVGLLAASAVIGNFAVKAADPYDKQLEARVAALERQLNVMEGDDKGKAAKPIDVPTFLRAKNKSVKELTISGDFRLRYQYQSFEPQAGPVARDGGGASADRNIQQSRPTRYRLRINFEYTMTDNMFIGWSIASGDNFGNDGTTATAPNGFGKHLVFIDKAYLGWNVIPKVLTVVGGIQDFPFYVVDDFIYDKTDLRVTGLTETYKTDFSPTASLELIAGQYIFADNVENNAASVGNRDVAWFATQAVFTIKPSNDLSFKIAPMFSFYASGTATGNGTAVGANGFPNGNSVGIGSNSAGFVSPVYRNAFGELQALGKHTVDNLWLFSLPMEANFKFGSLAVKPYAEFGYNFRGGSRAYQTYGIRANDFSDKSAFVVGLRFGALNKKGDWTVSADYRQMGLGSVDPNLNDPNWGQSQLNFRGMKLSAGYRFTNWLTGNITYYAGYNLRSNLRSSVVSTTPGGVPFNQNPGTGATIPAVTGFNTNITGLSVSSHNANQVLQIELNATF